MLRLEAAFTNGRFCRSIETLFLVKFWPVCCLDVILLRSSGVRDMARRSGVSERCFIRFRWRFPRPNSESMSFSGVNERCFLIEPVLDEASEACGAL